MEQLWTVVREIPHGRCASYGQVGAALDRPLSGLLVGRFLARCPEDVPWWRVVGRNGDLLVGKRAPEFAVEQESRLNLEGVVLVEGRVPMDTYGFTP